ncbi:hypothetical protein I4F81_003694 [Pyropia yezoensis]|uniref:Uncharacterized protein n=1 Tax=Pyropia yezoensis TaxID=2788 RepID=A0ACC3BTN5_PYRYE|nr:hypothetical protein I4F81_003694 [Neopyropia yezoensis]
MATAVSSLLSASFASAAAVALFTVTPFFPPPVPPPAGGPARRAAVRAVAAAQLAPAFAIAVAALAAAVTAIDSTGFGPAWAAARGSLWRALAAAFGGRLAAGGVFKLGNDVLNFVPPLLLGSVSLLFNQYFNANTVVQVRSRAALRLTPTGDTALHVAAGAGAAVAVSALLDRAARVRSRNDAGETPLHVAAASWRLDAVMMLLNRRAPFGATDHRGRSPLHAVAAGVGRVGAVRLVGRLGIPFDTPYAGITVLGAVVAAPAGVTPAVVAALSRGGAPADRREPPNGWTPLHTVVARGAPPALVLALVRCAGAPVDAAAAGTGTTPLHLAAASGRLPLVAMLHRLRATVSIAQADGATPLGLAVVGEHAPVVKLLAEAATEADVAAAEADAARRGGGRSPLTILRAIPAGGTQGVPG